jgi:hypothetical protein
VHVFQRGVVAHGDLQKFLSTKKPHHEGMTRLQLITILLTG